MCIVRLPPLSVRSNRRCSLKRNCLFFHRFQRTVKGCDPSRARRGVFCHTCHFFQRAITFKLEKSKVWTTLLRRGRTRTSSQAQECLDQANLMRVNNDNWSLVVRIRYSRRWREGEDAMPEEQLVRGGGAFGQRPRSYSYDV